MYIHGRVARLAFHHVMIRFCCYRCCFLFIFVFPHSNLSLRDYYMWLLYICFSLLLLFVYIPISMVYRVVFWDDQILKQDIILKDIIMLLSMFLNKQGYSLVLPESESRIQKWYQGVIKYIGAHSSSRTLHTVCLGVLDFPGHS